MKPFLLFLMTVACSLSMSAQSLSPKQVQKMLRKPALRCAMPSFMKDDSSCMSLIYQMSELSDDQLKMIADSAAARQAENQIIKQMLGKIDTTKVDVRMARWEIDGEQLRYDFFMERKGIVERNRLADQRPEPTAQLTRVGYNWSGMAHNPVLPMEIFRNKDGKVVGKCGFMKKEVVIEDQEALEKIDTLVKEEKLYQLHSSYNSIKSPLPGIPKDFVLDGMRWWVEIEYSDGTSINSRGEHYPAQDIHLLEKMMTSFFQPYISKMYEK